MSAVETTLAKNLSQNMSKGRQGAPARKTDPVNIQEAGSPTGQPGWGAEDAAPTMMRVRKRNGTFEPVDVNKIVRAISRCCAGLPNVDAMRIATKTIGGLYEGATTKELDQLSIQTAASLIVDEPEYSRLAARLLATYIDKEVANQEIHSFTQSISAGARVGLIAPRITEFVSANGRKLNAAIEPERNNLFEYFGLRTVYDRYLLKNPESRHVVEMPQYFFLRVACGLSETVTEAIDLYRLFSSLEYIPSSPTLFNSGTSHEQLSSCFLLDSPEDDLKAIYKKYTDVALLSKFAGGIGLSYTRVRSRGSLIKGTNGHSNGIVPWLKTLDASVAAVNQGGKRKGACCVYLETWHADIEGFLELRDNTGDEALRAHNLNLANWVPDLFMKRVEADEIWSLFDPKVVPHLPDLYADEFEEAYIKAEEDGLHASQINARDLYGRMMRTLAQTGNGWMTFKDSSNIKCNQNGKPGTAVHLSNLCTEIIEVTSKDETAVCNLGSINLARYIRSSEGAGAGKGTERFDFDRLRKNVRLAITQLNRVIDINFYPISAAKDSNARWRPIGLGVMGLQDVFFQLRLPFDAPAATSLSKKIQEEIYFTALNTSCDLAEKYGAHEAFAETQASRGVLQFDHWDSVAVAEDFTPEDKVRWDGLRERIKKTGLRNSLMIAIAPTATIASITGAYESVEPQLSNLFKRETLSGDFLQINRYLVADLRALGLWNEAMRARIKQAEGSIQGIDEIPENIRVIYRTAWEIPMRSLIDMAADRGAFIDQSQSLNLFVESPSIGKLSSMYMYGWKKGLKTTYYLRSRPATRIAQTTISSPLSSSAVEVEETETTMLACALENPETCEACQ